MNIAIILMKFNPFGGYERQAVLLAEAFADRGDKVTVFTNKWVGDLHPGGRHVCKLWNQKSFTKVGNTLVEKFNCKVIITGSAEEKILDDKIASKIKNAVSIAGALSIREVAALMKNAKRVRATNVTHLLAWNK